MDVSYFIARRLRFKGRMSVISIAVSFLVMIIAVSVSSGFRHEIRNGLAAISGDVQLAPLELWWRAPFEVKGCVLSGWGMGASTEEVLSTF